MTARLKPPSRGRPARLTAVEARLAPGRPPPPAAVKALMDFVHDRLQTERGRYELRTRLRALAEHTAVDKMIERRDTAAIVAELRRAGFVPPRDSF